MIVVILIFVCTIPALFTLITPYTQMPLALLVAYMYLALILVCRPYIRKGDDRLQLVAQNLIILYILCGYIFNDNDVGPDDVRLSSSAVLCCSCVPSIWLPVTPRTPLFILLFPC